MYLALTQMVRITTLLAMFIAMVRNMRTIAILKILSISMSSSVTEILGRLKGSIARMSAEAVSAGLDFFISFLLFYFLNLIPHLRTS